MSSTLSDISGSKASVESLERRFVLPQNKWLSIQMDAVLLVVLTSVGTTTQSDSANARRQQPCFERHYPRGFALRPITRPQAWSVFDEFMATQGLAVPEKVLFKPIV